MRARSSGFAEPIERIDEAEAFDAAYTTVRNIGAGASGRVILVEHRRTRVKCVLKKIPVTSMRDAAPLMKEVHVLAQLEHPNITRYHGSWHADGCLNILMEYADGGSLADSLRGRQEDKAYLDEDVLLDWFIQVTRAVHYIHERKIVHRDLKAQNVLLTKRGLIKVCDFGISKVLEETSGGSGGLASTCIGTPYYLSPEIVEAKKYGLPTDIWSLGVLLYEMAALKKPFEADSLPALAMRITRAVYDELPRCYSDELRALVRSLLQKEPADRPTTTDLLNDEFFMQHEDRFNDQLAELACLAHGLASARASFASPPQSQRRDSARRSVLTPPLEPPQPQSESAAFAILASTTIVASAGAPQLERQPIERQQPSGATAAAAAAAAAPAALVSAAPEAATIGRSAALAVPRAKPDEPPAQHQPPVRSASLPDRSPAGGPAGPGAGALRARAARSFELEQHGASVASRGGSVGHLLHVEATSPQAERAIACALRHELVIETSANLELTPSKLRASLEDNLRFSLNMRALESNLAASLEEDAKEEDGVGRQPLGAEAAAAAVAAASVQAQPQPKASAGGVGASAIAGAGCSEPEGTSTPARGGAADGTSTPMPMRVSTPLSIDNSGFITTRRSKRGERHKTRAAVSASTFAPPASPEGRAVRTPLVESN